MAKIHDKFVIELQEVIKAYGNDPEAEDPCHLPRDYKFYEMPGIAISEEWVKNMIPLEVVMAKESPAVVHGRWIQADLDKNFVVCSVCKNRGYKDRMAWRPDYAKRYFNFCPNCGCAMKEGAEDDNSG